VAEVEEPVKRIAVIRVTQFPGYALPMIEYWTEDEVCGVATYPYTRFFQPQVPDEEWLDLLKSGLVQTFEPTT
jgi:hypothetical protein